MLTGRGRRKRKRNRSPRSLIDRVKNSLSEKKEASPSQTMEGEKERGRNRTLLSSKTLDGGGERKEKNKKDSSKNSIPSGKKRKVRSSAASFLQNKKEKKTEVGRYLNLPYCLA